ncbi:MAG TPA: hypothetical protein VGG48_05800 [Rhizomicrobium sp.]|jgi:hypothetical protein
MKSLGWIAVCLLLSSVASAETLSVPPYPATGAPWKKITDKRDDPRFIWIEWIPADQTEADIHDILTEQIFYVQKGRDPSDFLREVFARVRGACTDVSINGPKAGTEDGHAVAYGQVYCVGASGKDVDIFAKAIKGQDALYVVQREFRRPAVPGAKPGLTVFAKDQKAEALARLTAQSEADKFLVDKVQLCDATCGGDAPKSEAAKPASDPNVDFVNGFINGKSTKSEIRDKLGVPTMENHRGDESVMLYSYKDGRLVITYLFDKNDVLVRFAAYAKN